MVTVPHRGPCAQARTWSLVTPSGRCTVTLTSRDSTATSSPTNCQYSSAVSLQRLAAPLATYSTVNDAVASVTSKFSCTVTTVPRSSTAYVPTSPLDMPTIAYWDSS